MLSVPSNLFPICFTGIGYAENAPQKVYDLANSTLAARGADSVIVKAVKGENSKGKTLDDI